MKYLFLVVILFSLNSYSADKITCDRFEDATLILVSNLLKNPSYSLRNYIEDKDTLNQVLKDDGKPFVTNNIAPYLYSDAIKIISKLDRKYSKLIATFKNKTPEDKEYISKLFKQYYVGILSDLYSYCLLN